MFLLWAKLAAAAKSLRSLDSPSVITINTFFTFDLEPLTGEKTLLLSKERSAFNTCFCPLNQCNVLLGAEKKLKFRSPKVHKEIFAHLPLVVSSHAKSFGFIIYVGFENLWDFWVTWTLFLESHVAVKFLKCFFLWVLKMTFHSPPLYLVGGRNIRSRITKIEANKNKNLNG